MYQVALSKQAKKSLKKIPKEYQLKFYRILSKLKSNPFELDIKKLGQQHSSTHRLRTGPYRIFLLISFEIGQILVVDIEHRTTQTYR